MNSGRLSTNRIRFFATVARLFREPLHADPALGQPRHRVRHRALVPGHLQDDPGEPVVHVRPPDVRHHVEPLPQLVDDGLVDEVLGEREMEPRTAWRTAPAHAGTSPGGAVAPGGFMLPLRNPSRSSVTYRYPRALRTSSARSRAASRTSAFVNPASTSGCRTPCSPAAASPGR